MNLLKKQKEAFIGISIMAIFVIVSILTNRGLLAANNTGSRYGYGYGYGPGNFPQQKTWNQAFGGNGSEAGEVIRQTKDGGYVIFGWINSSSTYSFDFLFQRFNKDGAKEWEKTFGGENIDYPKAMEFTPDGGYILVGSTSSYGSGGDTLIVKVDAEGNTLWQKNYGGSGSDNIEAIKSIRGGYILAGWTTSLGSSVDAWILQIDELGNQKWQKTTGGPETDFLYSVDETGDGGYVFAGYTDSRGSGCTDGWLLKTDSHGAERWNKLFGGSGCDILSSVETTSDGGYVVGGYNGSYDFWMIKTNDRGEKTWEKTFGGSNGDYGQTVLETRDGGYAIAGYTYSFGGGDTDGWIVKTDKNGVEEWNETYGGNSHEFLNYIVQTKDGGFAFTGQMPVLENSTADLWFVKTDREGNAPSQVSKETGQLKISASVSMPINAQFVAGSSKNLVMSYSLSASHELIDIEEFYITTRGNFSPQTNVSRVKLYLNGSQIGSANGYTFDADGRIHVRLESGTLIIPEDDDVTLDIKIDLSNKEVLHDGSTLEIGFGDSDGDTTEWGVNGARGIGSYNIVAKGVESDSLIPISSINDSGKEGGSVVASYTHELYDGVVTVTLNSQSPKGLQASGEDREVFRFNFTATGDDIDIEDLEFQITNTCPSISTGRATLMSSDRNTTYTTWPSGESWFERSAFSVREDAEGNGFQTPLKIPLGTTKTVMLLGDTRGCVTNHLLQARLMGGQSTLSGVVWKNQSNNLVDSKITKELPLFGNTLEY